MHSLIHSKTPSFFTLSAFADTQFKQPPPFLLSLPHRHTQQTHTLSKHSFLYKISYSNLDASGLEPPGLIILF